MTTEPTVNTDFLSEFAFPSLAIILNAQNCVYAMEQVSKGRREYKVAPPSIQPAKDAPKQAKDRFARIWRAQCNQFEWFPLSTALVICGSATTFAALNDYGKAVWGPRVIGALGVLHAIFRFQYIKGYVESAEGRSLVVLKPVLLLTGVSTVYLIAKQLVGALKHLRVAKQ